MGKLLFKRDLSKNRWVGFQRELRRPKKLCATMLVIDGKAIAMKYHDISASATDTDTKFMLHRWK